MADHSLSDRKTKESRFFPKLDEWYAASVGWALQHPMAIIGTAVATCLLLFPLNPR